MWQRPSSQVGLVEYLATAVLSGPVTAVGAQQVGGVGLGGGEASER